MVRQYYKKAVKNLKNLEFVGGNVYPCLYVNKSAKGIVYVALYIDDNLMVGDVKAIDDMTAALKKNGLVVEVMEGLQDYLFCEIKFSEDEKRAWFGQPHLIKKWKRNLASTCRMFRTIKLQVCLNFLFLNLWLILKRFPPKISRNINQV